MEWRYLYEKSGNECMVGWYRMYGEKGGIEKGVVRINGGQNEYGVK